MAISHKRVVLGCLLGYLCVPVLFFFSRWLLVYESQFPEIGEHVGPRWILPATASDVSYFDSAMQSSYEFSINEADIKQWAASRNWPLAEISEPQHFWRWSELRDEHLRIPGADSQNTFELHAGLFYASPERHRGGFLVGFDRSSQRCYLNWNHH